MKVSRLFNVSILVIILLVTVTYEQNNSSKLETVEDLLNREIILPRFINGKSSAFYQSDQESYSLFQSSILRAKLPGGTVFSNCDQLKKIHFELPYEISIGNILKSIETNDPDYRWEFSNGIFNLLPTINSSKLLNMPIKRFKVDNVTSYEALIQLLEKPEVKEQMVKNGLSGAVYRIHQAGVYIPESERINIPRFNFDIQSTTLRGVLNVVVENQSKRKWKYQGPQTWIYIERHCGKQTEFGINLVE